MRLWKRRSAAAESRRSEDRSNAAPAAFPPAAAHGGHPGGEAATAAPPGTPFPGAQSAPGPSLGTSAPGTSSPGVSAAGASAADYGRLPARTVRGRVLRADSAGAPPAGQTLPAVTTVTAHRRNGAVVASTVSEDGGYVLDGLPAEPLTLVAVEHPAVHEEVVVRAGDQRRDIALPAFPRKDLR